MRSFANRILPGLAVVVLAAAGIHAESGAHFTGTSANVSGAGEAIKINVTEWSPDSRRDEFVAAWTLTAASAPGRGGRGGGGAARGAAGRGARGAAAPATSPAPPLDVSADPDTVDPDTPAAPRGGRGGRGGAGAAAAQTPEASLAAAIKKAPTVGVLWTSENVGYAIKYAYRLPQPDGGERIILATDRRVGMWSNLWKHEASVTPSDYTFSIIELHMNSKGEGEGRGILTGKIAIDVAAKTIALDSYTSLPILLKGLKRQSGE